MLNSNMGAFSISSTVTYFGKVADSLDEQGHVTTDNQLNDAKLEKLLDDIIWYTRAIKAAKDRGVTNDR
jgi:hypothetical protein